MLSFTLLGQVSLYKDGTTLSRFRSQKEAALLVYLAHTGQTHGREFIADLLWGGRSTRQSLSNLRTALSRLRKQVGDPLQVTRKTVALGLEDPQQVDSVLLLETLAGVGKVYSAEKAVTLHTALDAYRGEFLEGFSVPDARRFDEWVTTTREQIRRQVLAAYEKLGQYALAEGDVEMGIDTAQRWLQVDTLDEAAHMLLVQLLVANGQTREAVAHYDYCVELLREELDIGPPAEMTALISEVRPASPPTLHPVVQSSILNQAAIPQTSATIRHNLSAPHDQFFGRESAQNDIGLRLEQPWCRLVTIAGPGGVGKTRLATTVARSRLDRHRDGVWLVELAEIDPEDADPAEAIAVEIAIALDLRLSGSETPVEQLLSFLQLKEVLLVLDNFEHLVEAGVGLVLDLLRRCEKVQLLVTSREALRIRAEWTVALTGLGYPADDEDETPSDAVELFAARWAQQRREEISVAELAAMGQICRLVEGLPLAIELAAALTSVATAQEIADQLRDGFAALETSLRDVPGRHRSLQIVFRMSWRTLTPTLQRRLARLSVFRGSFTEAAAQQIAGADAQQLAALGDKSLLAHDEAGDRYRLHAVVRAFAAEKRPATDQTRQKHARYYLSLLARHAEALQKNAPQASVAEIEPDMDNVRRAWQTGLAERQAALLNDALTSLSIYYQLRGLAHEAQGVMQTTVNEATAWESEGLALATRAGLERARFQNRLGRYLPAIGTVETALGHGLQCGDRWAEGMGHVLWGEALWRSGEYDLAVMKLTHALTIAQEVDSTLLVGWGHHHLGVINDIQGRYHTAYDHLQRACDAWRALEHAQALSNSLNSIGLVFYHRGDVPAAQKIMEETLTLCHQLGNRHLQSVVLNNLSIIYTEQGDYLSARHYLQLGLALATTNGNPTSQGEIYSNLGKNYSLLGNTDSAVENLQQGLRISESIGNRFLMAEIMIHLADAKRKQDDLTQADYWYNQALEITRQDCIRRTEYEALIGLAELWRKIDAKGARQFSTEAVALAEALEDPRLLERATAINHYLSLSIG